jgi:hypothetical protein
MPNTLAEQWRWQPNLSQQAGRLTDSRTLKRKIRKKMPMKGGFIAGLSTEAVICSVGAALHQTHRADASRRTAIGCYLAVPTALA